MLGVITPAERTQLQSAAASASNTTYIQMLYRLIFEREPSTAEIDTWTGLLTTDGRSRDWAREQFEANAEAQTPARETGNGYGYGQGTQTNTVELAPSWYPGVLKNTDGSAKIPPTALFIAGAALFVWGRR